MGLALLIRFVAALSAAVALTAQDSTPRFEVASVKKQEGGIVKSPLVAAVAAPPGVSGTYRTQNATVASLILFAYGIINDQLIGGPSWVREDFFVIDARAGREASRDEMRLMVRSLLEERFQLKIHREQRELKMFAIVLARPDGRLGPQLQQCTDPERRPVSRPTPVPRGGSVESMFCVPISGLAKLAIGILRGPVVDNTGLTGLWTFRVSYGREIDAAAPPFEAALQDQLGLKVESRREPVEVIVVDSVQQPSEN